MTPNPQDFISHLREEGYHSRSNKHSNQFCECMVGDLLRNCPKMRAVATRSSPEGTGLDAKAAVVLSMDNVHLADTRYVTTSPAPAVGDPMHYDAFIQAICNAYSDRFYD